MKLHRQKQSGFTLIEVMVVVVIIGILAAILVPNLVGETETANIEAAKAEVAIINTALKRYRLHNQRYPTADQGLKALAEKPTTAPIPRRYPDEPYLPKVPKDPWGGEYQYRIPGVHGKVDVYSLGPDPESPEDDIGTWNLDEI